MHLVRALPRLKDKQQINVFECRQCKVSFTTEDHLPIPGRPA